MEGTHDIHNRSRNRKQERRPRWKQKAQQNWSNNNSSNAVTDAADHGRLTKSLHELCTSRQLIESAAGIQKRLRVMRDLDAMLFAWSESLLPGSPSYAENMISPNPDKTAAPSLLSFGSYRLGVHTPDADVDCLVLAPPHVTRDDFFGSWVDVLKGEKERVTELHPVASAYTPVIKFEMDSVKIDLIFARVNNSKWLSEQRMKMTQTISDDKDDLGERIEMTVDDTVLIGLDETSVRSVNGVRVAQFLVDMLDGNQTRMDNFRLTLRAVKEWARVHGLYANVLGFLGGVNWAILVSWVCKRNPDAPASKLLQIFFSTFANWKWPNPVYLSKPWQNQPPNGVRALPVWNPKENFRDSKHLLPIITPCYPPMNSSYNVGEPQLRRLRDELWRANKLCNDVLLGRKEWEVLFEGNDFFKQHANYLQVNIIGTNDEFRSWLGLCESRMRVLVAGLESPLAGVRAYPFAKFFHHQEDGGGKYTSSFFVGLRFAHTTKRVDLGPLVEDFMQIVNSFEGRSATMDLTIHLVQKKNLPSFVFSADKVVSDMDEENNEVKAPCVTGDAASISKENSKKTADVTSEAVNESNINADTHAETPLPSSGKKKSLDAISPSENISPLKRTRIS